MGSTDSTLAFFANNGYAKGGVEIQREDLKMRSYTAVTKEVEGWWIGWIEEVPGVNCQEKTHEELLESLKTTLREAIQFNREEAINAAISNYNEELITV